MSESNGALNASAILSLGKRKKSRCEVCRYKKNADGSYCVDESGNFIVEE